MGENLSIEKRKKIISRIALIFLIVVLLLTFFSKSINNLLLPEVECTAPYGGKLEKGTEVTGQVDMSDTVQMLSNGTWLVNQVNVEVGDEVKKNDVLALIDESKVALELENFQLEVMRAQNNLDNYKDNYAGKGKQTKSDEFTRTVKQMELELKIKKTEQENYKKQLPQNGEIKADSDGTITVVAIQKGKTMYAGDVMFEITSDREKALVTWKAPGNKAKDLKHGDDISVKITEPMNAVLDGVVNSRYYIAQEGVYEFTAFVEESDIQFEDGQHVNIKFGQESAEYDVIIPASSVIKDSTGVYVYAVETRNGALGEEQYIKKIYVSVTDKDFFNAAVNGLDSLGDLNIVTYSTKVLYEGVQVKMK